MEIDEKLKKYFSLTKEALDKIKFKDTNKDFKEIAEELLSLAKNYYEDAHYFKESHDPLNALLAVTYAHAFLDAGARIGVFDIPDDRLLMKD